MDSGYIFSNHSTNIPVELSEKKRFQKVIKSRLCFFVNFACHESFFTIFFNVINKIQVKTLNFMTPIYGWDSTV